MVSASQDSSKSCLSIDIWFHSSITISHTAKGKSFFCLIYIIKTTSLRGRQQAQWNASLSHVTRRCTVEPPSSKKQKTNFISIVALRSRTICTALSHQAVYQTGSRYMSRPLAQQKKAKDDLKGKGREENRRQFWGFCEPEVCMLCAGKLRKTPENEQCEIWSG
jgi:hypothetical protein